ncbi:hypothetical protein [Streptomyces canus]|uniref:hypothetical protein n=1 Tax=Streptomyces canus TaxID=58343 RepID=UPI0027D84402|nr:hypothetical protein [Streptomyces canus]
MTRWLRTVRTTGLLIALGAGAVAIPCGAGTSYGAEAVRGVRYVPKVETERSEPVLHGARSVPRAETTASPSAEPSRAGSRAGEGRERPGRREAAEATETGEEDAGAGVGSESEAEPPADGDATVVAEPSREAVPDASPPPQRPGRQGVTRAESPTEPVLRILPLGSGLVLIGLGLGLAFVGLRVRRG